MSDILKSYFSVRDIRKLNNSASKNLISNKAKIKLINCGLFLSESNILKIPQNIFKESNIYKTVESKNLNYKNVIPFSSKSLNKKQNKYLKDRIFNNLIDKSDVNKFKDYYPLIENKKSKKNEEKVNKIINSLFKKSEESNSDRPIFYHANSTQYLSKMRNRKKKYYNKELFPREKAINPKAYIEYNFKSDPSNKKLFKSYDIQIKCLNNNEENRIKILKRVNENNKFRDDIEKLEIYNDNNNDVSYKDLQKMEKNEFENKKNFNFNKMDKNSNKNKLKNIFFNIDKTNENEYDNLITFDVKMNNAMNSTNNTLKYLRRLSHKNVNLIKKINNLVDGVNNKNIFLFHSKK